MKAVFVIAAACLGFSMVSAQAADPSCLKNATNQDLVNELAFRLGAQDGGDWQHGVAVAKTCGHQNYNGGCDYFNTTTVYGNYCASAKVCGHQNYSGQCDYFNVKAACGPNGCTKNTVCGHQNFDGKCDYFDESVSCS